MTPVELAQYVRLKTRTNSSSFPDEDLLILANHIKNEVCERALETDEDIFLAPTYEDLVADRREYPFLTSILSRIKRVEAKFSTSSDIDYIKLYPLDLTDLEQPIGSETLITQQFANVQGSAFYDIMRKSLWIYSGTIVDVTAGLKIWVNTYPANIATLGGTTDMSVDPSTTTHGIPKELHKVIAKGIVIEWKESREKPIPLTEREQKWEFDLEKAIATLKRSDYDREVKATVPDQDPNGSPLDGSEY